MTVPSERTRAVLQTREFLFALIDPKRTPGVPFAIREQASKYAKHYPGQYELNRSARVLKEVWGSTDGS